MGEAWKGKLSKESFPFPLQMVTRRLRHPIPDQRHRAHADGKRAEQAAFFVPADEQGGKGGDKEQVIPGDVELAVQNNIPAVYAVLFSLLVYAGAGQFIAVGLWGMGASVFSIVFTTFVINLRHVLMSAAVAPWFAPFTRFQQFIIGWGLTDEVFAMHSMAMATGEKARLPLVYAANFTSHSGWVLGTFIGAVAGDFLPDPKLFGLDYALPAMFLALLVPQCKERLYTLAAVLSALLSVILAMYDTGRWNVIIASVITSTIGALLVTHRDRNIDALRRKA